MQTCQGREVDWNVFPAIVAAVMARDRGYLPARKREKAMDGSIAAEKLRILGSAATVPWRCSDDGVTPATPARDSRPHENPSFHSKANQEIFFSWNSMDAVPISFVSGGYGMMAVFCGVVTMC